MIFGIGTDIVSIERIERALSRGGDRFLRKVLGEQELLTFFERQGQCD